MQTLRTLLSALFGVLLVASAAPAQSVPSANEGASDQAYNAYLAFNEAERAEKAGDLPAALTKYRRSLELYQSVAKNFPAYDVEKIAYRTRNLSAIVTRVETQLRTAPASMPAVAAAFGAGPMPAQPPAGAAPAPLASVAPAPASSASDSAVIPSLADFLKQWEDTVRSKALQLDQQNKQYEADLQKWQEWGRWIQGELQSAQSTRDALAQRSATLEQAVRQMQGEVDAGRAAQSQLDVLKKQLGDTQTQYVAVSRKLVEIEKQAKDMTDRLTDVTAKLGAVTQDRDKAAKERDEAVKARDEATKARDLALKERDATAKERDATTAQILGLKTELDSIKKTAGKGTAKDMLAKNEELKKELDAARVQIATLKKDVTAKDAEITQLKGQLTGVQTQLAQLKQENAAFQTQVSDLTLKLKEAEAKMAVSAGDPKLATENKVLRDLVLRQLRNQARQQQAKEMVIAELKKTENASKELLAQVEELGAGRVILTPEEEKLFSEPELKEALTTSGVQATLVAGGGAAPKAKTTEPAAPKPPAGPAASSAEALLDEGAAQLLANRLDDAAATYAEVLRADPRNIAGLIGLGNAKLRAAKYADAEAALKKCLSLDANNEAAHFTLGISCFKQNRHREAITSFESSLAVNKQNARAHHYLGISSTKLGLLDRAEREFKTALAIDPAYGDAHFNLAVLYVTLDPPRWDDARAQYQDALKKGVKPDPDLEKLLAPKTASAR